MENGFKIKSSAVSERGLSEKRPENEDSFLEIQESGIFAVADGVGGAQAGEVASQMAMEILAEAFANIPEGADAESVLIAAIERSNSAIFQMAHELPQLSNMATTIVALHMNGNIATIGHVGDSRLYRVDPDGNLFRETDDHSMVAEEVRAGRMTEEQAENHPSRNVISRALGAEPTVDVDVKTIMVEPGTAFLICSDGITRHVADQEIKGVLNFGGDPEEICAFLKDLCYERGAEDNLTAVVVKIAPEAASGNGKGAHKFEFLEEETTLATARPVPADEWDDELLELDTADYTRKDVDNGDELDMRAGETVQEDLETLGNDDVRSEEPYLEDEVESAKVGIGRVEDLPALQEDRSEDVDNVPSPMDEVPIVPVPVAEPVAEVEHTSSPTRVRTDNFPMFSDSRYQEKDDSSSGPFGGIGEKIGIGLLGLALGLGLYHFLLAPAPVVVPEQRIPPITEMQSNNQQLSAFEENRRTVDKMPTEALTRFGADPRDAEDYFLVGRAQMLLGHYPEAKRAFLESKNRIAAGDVDNNNRRTIETEIAIATAVLNDSTVQNIFKTQLDSTANTANSNMNAAR